MRFPALILLFVGILFPVYSTEIKTENGTGYGQSTAIVRLNSDDGSYFAGFSRSPVNAWSDTADSRPLTYVVENNASAPIETSNTVYAYWKLRSTGTCTLYMTKSGDNLSDSNGNTVPWVVSVPDIMTGGTDIEIKSYLGTGPTISEDTHSKVYSKDFAGQMDIDVRSLQVKITIPNLNGNLSGTFSGSLTLYLVTDF